MLNSITGDGMNAHRHRPWHRIKLPVVRNEVNEVQGKPHSSTSGMKMILPKESVTTVLVAVIASPHPFGSELAKAATAWEAGD